MNSESSIESCLPNLIDRLVGGDLENQVRDELIGYAEEHSEVWRAIGIAFLESQSWTEALSKDSCEVNRDSYRVKPLPVHSQPLPMASTPRIWNWIAVVAATVLVAFASGWWTNNKGALSSSNPGTTIEEIKSSTVKEGDKLWATLDARSMMVPLQGARIQVPIHIEGGKFVANPLMPRLSDYERDLYRRNGIHLEAQQRFIHAKLPDGRDLAIPFEDYVATEKLRTID